MNDLIREKASKIKLLAFDVDGVMTTGEVTYDENGVEYKSFNVKIKFKTSKTDAGQEKTFIPGTYTGDDNHLFNYDDIARYSVTDDGYTVLLESIADFTAEQKNAGTGSTASRPTEDTKAKETPKNEKETNVNPDLTEEKTPATPSVKKCSVSNSAFYKTGDCATVFTLISSFFTGTLAVFGIKKKD